MNVPSNYSKHLVRRWQPCCWLRKAGCVPAHTLRLACSCGCTTCLLRPRLSACCT